MHYLRHQLRRFFRQTIGSAGAETALLALLLCGACFLAGSKLSTGSRSAAIALLRLIVGDQ